jgi:hypothetical protein
MYNIHNHYFNLFSFLRTIVTHPRMIYLYPFGSSAIENIEGFDVENSNDTDPVFLCYDQEPLLPGYNDELFQHIRYEFLKRPIILLNTEQDSEAKEYFLKKYRMIDAYCFFHIFAAHDWYRGFRYDTNITPVTERKIKKTYVAFNRLTGSARTYRSMLVAELAKNNLLEAGHVSYSHICPDHGHYHDNLPSAIERYNVSPEYIKETIDALDTLEHPLRIDHVDKEFIPNHSMVLSAVPECMESFIYVVTETCFWESKKHLTEKIFKPIILRMPFVLVGCAHNLKYLRSYGFKTFDRWIDESYDDIEDPIERLQAVVKVLDRLSKLSHSELETMLSEMQETLDHNFNLFNSQELLDYAWEELKNNLATAVAACPK